MRRVLGRLDRVPRVSITKLDDMTAQENGARWLKAAVSQWQDGHLGLFA